MVDNNTTPVEPLDSSVAEKVRALCKHGYEAYDNGDTKIALRRFYSAWTLLPKPQNQWQEAGWILTALGDTYFAKGDYKNGQQALLSALHCPEADGNPSIHLRLGQCLYEMGKNEEALAQFQRVLEHGGESILLKEDPKYGLLVKSIQPKDTADC